MSYIVVEVEKLMCQQRHEKSNDIGKHNTITDTIVYSVLHTYTHTHAIPNHQKWMQCTEKMVGNGDVVFFYKNHLINFICGKENERGGENEA